MATSEELFISVYPQVYLESKSADLIGQAELLHTLKRIQNLKVLSRQKNDLKKTLYNLLASISSKINSIQNKMPTSKIPKAISKQEWIEPELRTDVKKPSTKKDEIEEELKEIHAKLQELNS